MAHDNQIQVKQESTGIGSGICRRLNFIPINAI